MKKRDVILNILPFMLWIALFILRIFDIGEGELMFFAQIALILVLPLILSIYNTVISDDCEDIFIKNIFMAVSNILGIIFSSALSDSFIQRDPKASPVIALFVGVVFIYTGILTLICCGIKYFVKKR